MLFSFQGGKKLHLHGSCGITWSKALKAAYLPHSGSQAEPHPGAGSPSGRQDAGSEGYLLQSSCSSANHLARPADSHSWKSWPVSYWERVRIKQTVRAIKPKIKARRVSVAGSYRVDRVWRVSKAPGVIVVSWLSYRDNRRTLWSPVKLSLWIQLILLFLNILMTKEIHINKKKNIRNFSKYGQVWGCDSQHSQSLKATEHPTSNRVHLIGCEVKLIDRGRAFKCPIFNLCDLVVAEVTVCLWGEKESMSEN